MVYSKTAKGWGVRHILIYAGNPYNVTDRPGWFTEVLFNRSVSSARPTRSRSR